VPSWVVLLTDFDAVPATARADVVRGIGGTEPITVNAPSTLSLDPGPGRGGPQARIALLPGNGAVTGHPRPLRESPPGYPRLWQTAPRQRAATAAQVSGRMPQTGSPRAPHSLRTMQAHLAPGGPSRT
jgi:hypothetical protein